MSILDSKFFSATEISTFIKESNYNESQNSNRNYAQNYFNLIKSVHTFQSQNNLTFGNNGYWYPSNFLSKSITQIEFNSFRSLFEDAWGNRANHFSNNFTLQHLTDTQNFFISERSNFKTLLCNNSIQYLKDFVSFVFKNQNPYPTLVYFSKYVSTFLPDLAISFDTSSLEYIGSDLKVKKPKNSDKYSINEYFIIHEKIKSALINFLSNNSLLAIDIKSLDNSHIFYHKPAPNGLDW